MEFLELYWNSDSSVIGTFIGYAEFDSTKSLKQTVRNLRCPPSDSVRKSNLKLDMIEPKHSAATSNN